MTPEQEPGVLLLDDRRIFVAANEAAATLLGTTREELIGRRADEFMPVVARRLYPLAWKGFLVVGRASGDYAAQLADGSLAHLAYVGFANRPVRGLHFFVLEPLVGTLGEDVLVPRQHGSHIQVGRELPGEVQARLWAEADREEWKLPIQKGGERSILAALFDGPADALDALYVVRQIGDASIATAAGATRDTSQVLLAGHFPNGRLGTVVETIRKSGGRIITHVDERWA